MPLQRERALHEIIEKLAQLESNIRLRNSEHLFDIDTILEDF